mmetsp:Transcript_16882/g.23706  ORF Transcript_16882/g.23706 Transcript_16882/m.23706 type:complete len:200 (-) Transcript_16882:369-968(-)
MHHMEGGRDHLWHSTSDAILRKLLLPFFLRLHVLKLLLISPAIGNHGTAGRVGLHPIIDGLQELVLFSAEVFLVHVDRVHARLCGEQAVIVDELNVFSRPLVQPVLDILPILKPRNHFLHGFQLFFPLLQVRRRLRSSCCVAFLVELDLALHVADVFQAQLTADGVDVAHWIYCILGMDDIVIFERTHDVHNTIHRLNV